MFSDIGSFLRTAVWLLLTVALLVGVASPSVAVACQVPSAEGIYQHDDGPEKRFCSPPSLLVRLPQEPGLHLRRVPAPHHSDSDSLDAAEEAAAARSAAPGGGGKKVYRGLAEGEDVSGGLRARAPGVETPPASHVAGKRESCWISTGKDRAHITEKYGAHGVVEIDLGKVSTEVVDLSRGIPGKEGTMISNWAKEGRRSPYQGRCATGCDEAGHVGSLGMDVQNIIAKLEREWSRDDGFFGLVRGGSFDPVAYERVCLTLREIDLGDEPSVNRRLVSLLWYIPLFLSWQRERVGEAGGNEVEFVRASAKMEGLVQDILGIP